MKTILVPGVGWPSYTPVPTAYVHQESTSGSGRIRGHLNRVGWSSIEALCKELGLKAPMVRHAVRDMWKKGVITQKYNGTVRVFNLVGVTT